MKKMSELVTEVEGGILTTLFDKDNWREARRLSIQLINGELAVAALPVLVLVNVIDNDTDLTTAKTQPYRILDLRSSTVWVPAEGTWTEAPLTQAPETYYPGSFVRSVVTLKLYYANADRSLTQVAAG